MLQPDAFSLANEPLDGRLNKKRVPSGLFSTASIEIDTGTKGYLPLLDPKDPVLPKINEELQEVSLSWEMMQGKINALAHQVHAQYAPVLEKLFPPDLFKEMESILSLFKQSKFTFAGPLCIRNLLQMKNLLKYELNPIIETFEITLADPEIHRSLEACLNLFAEMFNSLPKEKQTQLLPLLRNCAEAAVSGNCNSINTRLNSATSILGIEIKKLLDADPSIKEKSDQFLALLNQIRNKIQTTSQAIRNKLEEQNPPPAGVSREHAFLHRLLEENVGPALEAKSFTAIKHTIERENQRLLDRTVTAFLFPEAGDHSIQKRQSLCSKITETARSIFCWCSYKAKRE